MKAAFRNSTFMMELRFVLLLVVAAAPVGCAASGPYPYAKEPDPRAREYVLDVPDKIKVSVWGHNELTTQASLRPDGTFTMPLIGDMPAAGKTPTELKALVGAQLKEYVKLSGDNAVSVEVVAIGSYRITVTGNVSSPGVLTPDHYVTVAEAVTRSGGPNKFADPEDTEVIRTRPDGKVVRIPIRYDLLERGEALEQDIVLLRGDVVYMP